MGVKHEASPFASLAKVYVIGANHAEGGPLPTPHINCTINVEIIYKALYDIVAHVSVMSSKIYDELYNKTLKLAPTQLVLEHGRTTKPFGVLRDLDVAVSGKAIPMLTAVSMPICELQTYRSITTLRLE